MAKSNKQLTGFEALYQAEQAQQTRSTPNEPLRRSKEESNKVSNITDSAPISYEATTFKADRRKVKALKRLALDLEPSQKLQDLFDEALADLLTKYGQSWD
jgi:hypothetical protein